MIDDSEYLDTESESATWIALADLMTGLMAIFLALAIAVLVNTSRQRIVIIQTVSDALRSANIQVKADPVTGDIGVQDSNLLFGADSAALKDSGRQFLDEFVPAYSQAIFALPPELADQVVRVVVEGRTSSSGSDSHNMTLSLNRANAVVQYIFTMPDFPYKEQMIRRLTPVGRGRSEAAELEDENDRQVLFRFQFAGEMLKAGNADAVASQLRDAQDAASK